MIIDRQIKELQATFALVDAFLEAERETRKLPGLSCAIVYDQEVLWSKGFGFANIEQKIVANPQTIYRIASVTKLFTATMMMRLRDSGRLHLDDPLEKYLPSGKVQSRFTDPSPITFRQVVAHIAGLPRDDSVERVYEGNVVIFPSREEIQANLKEMELIVAPMTKIQYSNLGFALLGLALEQVAGQSYTRYVTEQILRPLGMESSGFEPVEEWPSSLQPYIATPYKPHWESDAVPSAAPLVVEQGMNPAGGLYSSVEDIARFISLQFLDGPAQGKQILKGSTLREMHAPVFLDPNWNAATAIGWRIERMHNYTTIGHNGSISGFSSDVLIVPVLKLGVALFVNTTTDASELNRAILELLLPVFSHLLQRQREAQSPLPPTPTEWQRYEGCYTEPKLGQSFEICLKADRLVLLSGDTEATLLPQSEHSFCLLDGPFEGESIRFVLSEDNVVMHARITGLIFVHGQENYSSDKN